jgi:MoaA/NifB/PqqE/SkfB family radical SAM enzyme
VVDAPSLNLRFLPYDRKMQPRDVDEATLRRERLALIEEWLPTDRRFAGPYYEYVREHDGALPPLNGRKWTPCEIPWREAYISWDGDVNLCCATYERKDRLGNVFEEPLAAIWNNARFRAARRDILGTRRGEDPPVLCHECLGRMI